MGAAPNFNLTIIFESTEAGKRAKRFSDQFMAEAAVDCTFELNLWNFEVLGIPEIRNTAASTAAMADMVVLSVSGTVPLPAPTIQWIEMWTWLIDGRRPVVVALFAGRHRASTAIRAYLRRSAVSKKLDFFPIMPRAGESFTAGWKQETNASGHQDFAAGLPFAKPPLARHGGATGMEQSS